MNYLHLNNLRLATRNEGKIKSYDSCTDIRAWSHDLGVQDRYLREWMKADMPVCFIPCCSMTGCLTKMTCRTRRRAIPRCHPDCKSKVLLDSICNSCRAVKQCLLRDETMEKYFVEVRTEDPHTYEELESSQWPCDKCLDALKSIKMFWKILLDKIFGINISKCNKFDTNCECADSVRSVARLWQSDILRQASFVQNTPSLCRPSDIMCKRKTCSAPEWREPSLIGDNKCNSCPQTCELKPRSPKKVSKYTSIRINTIDCGCNTRIDIDDEIYDYIKTISCLEAKYNNQNYDLIKLQKENSLLRKEVENVRQGYPWKASFFIPEEKHICRRSVAPVQKPLECHLEENCCPVNNIDSEMIITMKNGQNESFRHVSLLQVLHKTNAPITRDTNLNRESCCKKEDPIEILNKVHNTVGAIVKREMCIANDRKYQPQTEVDATYHRLHSSKSAPSCCTISSQLSCEADYACAKQNESCHRAHIRVTNI